MDQCKQPVTWRLKTEKCTFGELIVTASLRTYLPLIVPTTRLTYANKHKGMDKNKS